MHLGSMKPCLCVDWCDLVCRPADIVTDETEACGTGLLLHGTSESGLSRRRHGVCFIQDDDLKRRTWLPANNTGNIKG